MAVTAGRDGSVVERLRLALAERVAAVGSLRAGADRDGETGAPTNLFRCQACQTTYVSVAMESCPRCEQPVTRTPTAAELGFGRR